MDILHKACDAALVEEIILLDIVAVTLVAQLDMYTRV